METTERTSELVAFRGDNLVTDSDTVARIFENDLLMFFEQYAKSWRKTNG